MKFSVITVSSSRGKKEDVSGAIARKMLEERGHEVVWYSIVPDDEERIREEVVRSKGDVVITTGGTGLSPDDVTIEAVSSLIKKEMPGFGELFRRLSFEEIGTATILTRAIAGIIDEKVIFCLPGSPNAVELALSRIILPEISHIMKHLRSGTHR
ncbi:MAG: MogA/MoaB family molybdenum cofactor biosynthesis protein [Candidatus Syntropharchaeia archaeon]